MGLLAKVMFAMASSKPPTDPEYSYESDNEGLWLVRPDAKGETRTQLANFRAQIITDIVEDDGTTITPRFFEVEATQGEYTHRIKLAAKDFEAMSWVAETLGATARVYPGAYFKEHAHAAIQEQSQTIEACHAYTHIGWRVIDGAPCYLHHGGAITAEGLRKDLCVALGEKFSRYQVPPPPTGEDAIEALRASLALRTVGPNQLMTLLLPTAYLAPLREFLLQEPPDFVTWLLGKTGHYKSEYTVLAQAHFGNFSRLTLPASFESTGNGLERMLHTPKDSLLVIDDFHPPTSRKEGEAMEQVAARLLRGIGNQSARLRMRRDTSMQADLPPRCLALVSAEILPHGLSNSARMFLVSVPPQTKTQLAALGKDLGPHQKRATLYAQAMAVYLRWIARHWDHLMETRLPRFRALQDEIGQNGVHAREPGQVAHLLLAWETFTDCAVDEGAITKEDQATMLKEAKERLLTAAADHSAILAEEQIATRTLTYLRAGLASKHIYLRDPSTDNEQPPDATIWGWTGKMFWDGDAKEYIPGYEPGHAQLLGYVDEDYVYLIPKTLHQYLHQAATQEGKHWAADSTTLLRELESAQVIHVKKESDGRVRREVGKTIRGMTHRLVWVYREVLMDETADLPTERGADPDDEIPF
jgi:hypothetical protein